MAKTSSITRPEADLLLRFGWSAFHVMSAPTVERARAAVSEWKAGQQSGAGGGSWYETGTRSIRGGAYRNSTRTERLMGVARPDVELTWSQVLAIREAIPAATRDTLADLHVSWDTARMRHVAPYSPTGAPFVEPDPDIARRAQAAYYAASRAALDALVVEQLDLFAELSA